MSQSLLDYDEFWLDQDKPINRETSHFLNSKHLSKTTQFQC